MTDRNDRSAAGGEPLRDVAGTSSVVADAEVSIVEELLRSELADNGDVTRHRFSPLLAWLVTTVRPRVAVDLGLADRSTLLPICDAVSMLGDGGRCLAVRMPGTWGLDGGDFHDDVRAGTDAYPDAVAGYEDPRDALRDLGTSPSVDFLHLGPLNFEEPLPRDVSTWFEACAPGAAIVITSTAARSSGAFAAIKEWVTGSYPAVSIPFGVTTEAVVAQIPVMEATPAIDLLRSVPPVTGLLVAMLSQDMTEVATNGVEAVSPGLVRAMVAGILEREQAERRALISAAESYRRIATKAGAQLAQARRDLVTEVTAARAEREQLTRDFFDQFDVLTAKISTSAARFTAELEDKDRLLAEQEAITLAYAGKAATAQSVIDDIYASSSWKYTAPLRLFSRLTARRRSRPPVA